MTVVGIIALVLLAGAYLLVTRGTTDEKQPKPIPNQDGSGEGGQDRSRNDQQ